MLRRSLRLVGTGCGKRLPSFQWEELPLDIRRLIIHSTEDVRIYMMISHAVRTLALGSIRVIMFAVSDDPMTPNVSANSTPAAASRMGDWCALRALRINLGAAQRGVSVPTCVAYGDGFRWVRKLEVDLGAVHLRPLLEKLPCLDWGRVQCFLTSCSGGGESCGASMSTVRWMTLV